MNNLVKLNDDLVVMDKVPVHFKNYAVGGYTSKETICMVYIWDTYIMTLDEAFYIGRETSTMEDQFDFIQGIIDEELVSNSERVIKDNEVIIQFPFVTSTITEIQDGFCVLVEEVSDEGVVNHFSEVLDDCKEAEAMVVKLGFELSKSIQTDKYTKVWVGQ